MKKPLLIILPAGAVVIAVIAVRLGKDRPSAIVSLSNETVAVSTAIAEKHSIREVLRYTGSLEARNQAAVISQTTGIVEKIALEPGTRCKKDAVLVFVENQMQEAALEQAKAQVLAMETNYQKSQNDQIRAQNLYRDSVVTSSDLELATLNAKAALAHLKTAQAGLSVAQKQLADTYIKASISGRIASKKIDVGSTVSPGTVVAVIVDDAQFKIKILIGERDIVKIKRTQPVDIIIDAFPAQMFRGSVQSIGSLPEESGKSYPVEIVLIDKENSDLKTGMFARCAITVQTNDTALTVPDQAVIISQDGSACVYVSENGRARNIPVVLGVKSDTLYEILSGITRGTRVITAGKERIKNGSMIREQAATR